jgi:predicted kinase
MLIVLIGQSGSGKSYLARELETFDDDFVTVSSDAIRKEVLGDINNQEKGAYIFEILKKKIDSELKKKKNVIWDSTNLNWTATKKAAIYHTEKAGTYPLFVFMMDSLESEKCKDRVVNDIKNKIDRSQVPDDKMDQQHERFKSCLANARKDIQDFNIFLYYSNFVDLIEEIEELEWDDKK